MNVSGISENGATFNANLYSLGTETILNHGFVWDTYSEPEMNGNRIYLGTSVALGNFSANVNTTLQKDVEYFVRPFVQTNNHTVYGKTVSFKSLGSGAPTISHFEPLSATWLDTITITGKNFSWVANENIVKLDDIQCNVLMCSDTVIKILVSQNVSSLKSILSVDLAQNTAVMTKDTFRFEPPVLYDYYPKQARWGDTITVKGQHISPLIFDSQNFFKLGSFTCPVISVIGDSMCSIKIPYEISSVTSIPMMKLQTFYLTNSESFQLLPTSFNLAPPNEGTWGDVLTLNGKFNTITARNTFLFNGIQATVVSTSENQVKVRVPGNLTAIKTAIEYKVTPFDIFCQDTFLLKAPRLYSINPLAGTGGSNVTIRGKYFSINNTTVYFGTTVANIVSMNDSTITVRVPSTISSSVNISVKVMLQTISFPDRFYITNPIITSITPLSGTFSDEITIDGENFAIPSLITTVKFGDLPATITSLTSSAIIVKVPLDIDSIPRSLTVQVGTNSVTSTDKFTLSPHVVQTISSSEVQPGQDIRITGINFNLDPTKIKVKWDIYSLAVKSSSLTEIVAAWPVSLPNGSFPLKVSIGGYTRSSPAVNYTTSAWKRIEAPILSTGQIGMNFSGGMTIMGITVNGNGYLCSPASAKMYKFSAPGSWNEIITNYPFSNVEGLTSVICRDTIFHISGYDHNIQGRSGMSLYNEGLNSWKKVSDFPSQRYNGIVFSLKNKIYIGTTTFHVCDPSDNYQWAPVGNLPVAINYNYAAYFSLNDKGYILYNNNQFWMYDPDLNVWIRKNNFPGTARIYGCSAVVGENAYLGTGQANVILSDIWKYNVSTDSWIKVSDMPIGRRNATTFVLDNKIYIGYGTTGSSDLYDFYEFDPSGL